MLMNGLTGDNIKWKNKNPLFKQVGLSKHYMQR